jgi:hypothetical protein
MDGIYFVIYRIGTIHFFKIILSDEKKTAVWSLDYGKNKHKKKEFLLVFVGIEDDFVCHTIY